MTRLLQAINLDPGLFTLLVIFVAVDLVALAVFLIFQIHGRLKRREIRHYGDRAEEKVAETIRREFPGAVLLNDVILETRRGTTQIDHILICKWGLYIIETKSHNGRILVADREWTQIYGEKVVRFHSPLKQNQNHVNALRNALDGRRGVPRVTVQGLVVFTSRKVSFSQQVKGVVRLQDLGRTIKGGGKGSSREPITSTPGRRYLNSQQIAALEKAIKKSCVRSRAARRRHERRVREIDRNARY